MVLDFVESLKAGDVEYDGYGAVQVTVEGRYRYPEVKAYWNERADTVGYRIELTDNAVDVTDDFGLPASGPSGPRRLPKGLGRG